MLPPSPFTLDDTRAAGISPYDWRLLRQSGQVRRLLPGIYADALLPDTLDLRLAAVARILPPEVVVARCTAAWTYGVDALDPRAHPIVPLVETASTERSRRPKHRLVHSHLTDDLTDDDVVELNGVRLTSPLRTAADLGRFLPRPRALAALDAMLHAELVTKDELWSQVDRWQRRRGIRQLVQLIQLADKACESAGESRMRLRVVDAGLPCPELQIEVTDASGRVKYRIDAGYRALLVGFEYDGAAHHGPGQAEADRLRREWLVGENWLIAVFRADDVYGTNRVVELTVRGLIDRRTRR